MIYRTAEELLISTDAQILKLAIRRNRPDFRLGLQLEYDLRQAREELRAKIECEVHPLVCA